MPTIQRYAVPPVLNPIVPQLPEAGRSTPFRSDHAETIQGWNYQQGRDYIDEVMSMAITENVIYTHRWSPRDCAIWDNRCMLHRATTFASGAVAPR